jgi:hypothetical protein
LTKIISLSNHYPRVLEFDRNIENDPVLALLKKDQEEANIGMNTKDARELWGDDGYMALQKVGPKMINGLESEEEPEAPIPAEW